MFAEKQWGWMGLNGGHCSPCLFCEAEPRTNAVLQSIWDTVHKHAGLRLVACLSHATRVYSHVTLSDQTHIPPFHPIRTEHHPSPKHVDFSNLDPDPNPTTVFPILLRDKWHHFRNHFCWPSQLFIRWRLVRAWRELLAAGANHWVLWFSTAEAAGIVFRCFEYNNRKPQTSTANQE